MALKDWMEAIMFLWRLRGRTMQRETAKSRTIRKLPDTCKRDQQNELGSEHHTNKVQCASFFHREKDTKPGSTSKATFCCCVKRFEATRLHLFGWVCDELLQSLGATVALHSA